MGERRLAALNLISDLPIASLGNISWVEVMEPRPEKLGKDVIGLEHMEFYYPDFDEVREVLQANDISFVEESNPGHQWINIVISDQGQELKLNNRPLAVIVEEEIENGVAHLLL